MTCAWDAMLSILPARMRQEVDKLGRRSLRELRLRQGAPPELILPGGSVWLEGGCTRQEIGFCIQAASRYSPWASESVREGFLTAPGGHRIGLCGLSLYRDGVRTGLREITSVCIRVARDFPGIAQTAPSTGSVLILGAPGWGKTTLLRDLVRQRSRSVPVSVLDQRGELFPSGFDMGLRTDILRGCRKEEGLEQLLRTMGPSCIALDEITAEDDCEALIRAAHCGVTLLATAHAASMADFRSRPLYQRLGKSNIFDHILLLTEDKTFREERMVCT
ncbi:MAG: stage III sporulation protein AB [Oscillospiraceae bacterium]|nr:stage III sporulation protein AB [Oscillospiraceae bacterium]